jgi:hypothetical protein
MYGDLETQKVYWKELDHDLVTVDKKVSNRPCFLYSACLVAGTGGAATAVIRDGHETASEAVLDLGALTSSNDIRKFDPPLYLKKGMFVDVGSNVTSVFVLFLAIKD